MTREEAEKKVHSIFLNYLPFGGDKEADEVIKALGENVKPYEKFKSAKDHICKLAGDYKCWDNRLTHDEALELCNVLEQDSVLDKIKAEIEQNAYPIVHGVNNHEKGMTLNGILQVIDKYKAGSEV